MPDALLFDWIGKRALGGVKIFGWNAEDSTKVAKAVAAMQEAALGSRLGIPLLVATDQEGGWITAHQGRDDHHSRQHGDRRLGQALSTPTGRPTSSARSSPPSA